MKNMLITALLTVALSIPAEMGRVYVARSGVDVSVNELLAGKASDIDGDPIGVAVINAAPGWEYSLNEGTSWLPVGEPTEESALLLAEASRLRHDRSVLPIMTIRAWDQTSGTVGTYEPISETGGTTAYSENSAWRAYVSALTECDVDMDLLVKITGFDGINNVAQVQNPQYTVTPPEMGTWEPRLPTDPPNAAGRFRPSGILGPCVLSVTGNDKRGNPIPTPGTLGITVVAGAAKRIEVEGLEMVAR